MAHASPTTLITRTADPIFPIQVPPSPSPNTIPGSELFLIPTKALQCSTWTCASGVCIQSAVNTNSSCTPWNANTNPCLSSTDGTCIGVNCVNEQLPDFVTGCGLDYACSSNVCVGGTCILLNSPVGSPCVNGMLCCVLCCVVDVVTHSVTTSSVLDILRQHDV